MIRVKLLAVVVGMLATLAVTAVPAFAEFESNSTATKGIVKVGAITIEGGGMTLTCTSAEGTWTILSGGKAATKGTNEQLDIEKYAGCKLKTALVTVTPSVFPCTLELEQAAGKSTAIGSIVGSCKAEVKVLGPCTVTATGKDLTANNLANVGSNDVITAADTGITLAFSGSGCIAVTNTNGAKAKATATTEGQKWL
jgi:hypothetical protein